MTQLNCFHEGTPLSRLRAKSLRGQLLLFLVSPSFLDAPSEIKSQRCASKEQKPETPCHSHGSGEPLDDKLEQNESKTKTNDKPAADGKVSTPKAQSKSARKLGSKKLSVVKMSVA